MAISNQIQRLTTLRNNIRTKLINLGILPAASTSATLSECYNVLSSVTGLGASSYTPTTVSQVIPSGRYLSGAQTINAIPSAYIIPSGTVVLSSSGTFDVGSYASADVTVTGGPSGPYVDFTHVSIQGSTGWTRFGSITLKNYGSVIPNWALANLNSNFINSAVHAVWGTIDNISSVKVIGEGAFFDAQIAPDGLGKSIVVFPECEIIAPRAFYSTSIGYATFWSQDGCTMSMRSYMQLVFPKLTEVGSYAFAQMLVVSKITFPVLDKINNGYVFSSNMAVKELDFPALTSISGHSMFANCTALSSISFPNLTFISGNDMFANCTALRSISFPNVTFISGLDIFFSCVRLSEIYMPVLKSVNVNHFLTPSYSGAGTSPVTAPKVEVLDLPSLEMYQGNCFAYYISSLARVSAPRLSLISGSGFLSMCTNLSYVYAPALTTISGGYNFTGCRSLTEVSFPALTTISGGYNFSDCDSLTEVRFPALTTISGTRNFANCAILGAVDLPEYTYTGSTPSMFENCMVLSIVSMPKTSSLYGNGMFSGCYNLISLFLLGSSVCALGNTIASMFRSTPISTYSTSAGRWGSVFVPASLLAQYKAATNWTTISSKIFAYEDYFS